MNLPGAPVAGPVQEVLLPETLDEHILRQEFGAVAAAAVARRMVVPPSATAGRRST